MRSKLKYIIESDSPVGRAFDACTQVLIFVSLVAFSVETLPGLSESCLTILAIVETVSVALFTIEYLSRIWVADSRLAFATSFFGAVDLLAILPFYLSLGIDLRSVRAFRLLRLFRVLKLGRYSNAVQRFYTALQIAKEEIVLFMFVTCVLLFLSAVGIYQCEHGSQPEVFPSIPHSLWWAVTTLTTVGYGDAYPVTPGGKFFTACVLFVGLGVVSVPAGLVASALSKARELEGK